MNFKKNALALSLSFFVLSRLWILFGLNVTGTDVFYYLSAAVQSLGKGVSAYTGYEFPYPPLTLGLIYLPGLVTLKNYDLYRLLFRLEMCGIECLLLWAVLNFSRTVLEFSNIQRFFVVIIFTVLGLFEGQLLYDRMDLGVALFVFLILWAATQKNWFWLATLSNLGILYKFIPVLPALFLKVAGENSRNRRWLFLSSPLLALPALVALGFIDTFTNPGIFESLLVHQDRGIQIESIWATPFMLARALNSNAPVATILSDGAYHLTNESVPLIYFEISKVLGLILLALAFLKFVLSPPKKVSFNFQILTTLSTLMIFISTQRVLSPQYFIWFIPLFSLYLVLNPKPLWGVLTFISYLLTYIEYEVGYLHFLYFHLGVTLVVALRNLILIGFTGLLCQHWFKELENLETYQTEPSRKKGPSRQKYKTRSLTQRI